MTNIDDIPSHFINKAGIANRLSISRVTVDRALTKIAKDPILHSRLKVHIVSEGKRTLYFYDPSDVDAVFGELQRTSRGRSKTVRSINRKVTTTSTSQSNALLERDVQHLQNLLAKADSEIADLKDQREKKDRQIEFLQAQLTDQRPNVVPTAPEATEEVVVPPVTEPKPSNVIDIRKAIENAKAKSNKFDEVTQAKPIREGDISIVDCRLKVSTAMSFENDLPDTHTDKVWIVCHRDDKIYRSYDSEGDTILGAFNIEEPDFDEDLLKLIVYYGIKKDVVLTDALKSHSTAYQVWNTVVSAYEDLDDEAIVNYRENLGTLETKNSEDETDTIRIEPKPSTLAEIKEAVADVDKSNVGRKQTEIDEYNELCNKISSGTYSDSLEEAVETQRIWNFISVDKESFPPNIVTRWSNRARATRVVCLVDLTETASGEMKVGKNHDLFKRLVKDDIDRRADEEPYIYMVDPVRIDPPFPDHVQKEIDIEREKIAKEKADASSTDAEPEEQPESPPIEDTQPTEEAPKEKEARRDNIAPKAEPQQVQKKGFWNWLKGY